MYAIFEDGGRQYRVSEGQRLLVDRRDVSPGAELRFDRVVLLSSDDGVKIGTPTVDGAVVVAVVEGEVKGPKLVGRHRTLRNRTQTKKGHRQRYTEVRVTRIES